MDLLAGLWDCEVAPLSKETVEEILDDTLDVFSSEKRNVVHVELVGNNNNNKLTICGDTHGQLYDVLELFRLNGVPCDENAYLFNGDFVDRGIFGVELALTLFIYKLKYPKHVYLLRGNHESRSMTNSYGFAQECIFKYGDRILEKFYTVFNSLPLAAVVENKYFVVHGGLSKQLVKIESINEIERFQEPERDKLLHDLLWNDPHDNDGWCFNKQRGGGSCFGPDITKNFLKENNLQLLIRSHQVEQEGYGFHHNNQLLTIFSAPNYCDTMGNKGAYLQIQKNGETNIFQFKAVDHPSIETLKAKYNNNNNKSKL